MSLFIPKNYKPAFDSKGIQYAIKLTRDTFQAQLESELGLTRVSAPLFVRKSSGLNDNLSGVETPVSFSVNGVDDDIEIVHSLAKWKRAALKKYNFEEEEGFYTNMTAIRKDEDLDNLHSVYVDQWDWEKVISADNRNAHKLVAEVAKIFSAIKNLEEIVCTEYENVSPHLPDDFAVISTQELLDVWPDLSPKERENKICRDKGCVLLTQIGKELSDGTIHDTRSPDYDDWEMNGDILFWYEPLKCALEISSMGVRVDENSIVTQLKAAGCEGRMQLPYHSAVIDRELPYTIGGGIGQSRLCMLILQCAHVGEVQSSVWPDTMIDECAANGIRLL